MMRHAVTAAAMAAGLLVAVAAGAQVPPGPVGKFEGQYRGSYQMPEGGQTVQVAITMVPADSKVKIRWKEVLGAPGSEMEAPRVFDITGMVKGPQLRFITPRASLFPRTTYTAVRWGQDLLVHLRLYAHPEGYWNDDNCEACEEIVKEVKLVKE